MQSGFSLIDEFSKAVEGRTEEGGIWQSFSGDTQYHCYWVTYYHY